MLDVRLKPPREIQEKKQATTHGPHLDEAAAKAFVASLQGRQGKPNPKNRRVKQHGR